MADPSSANTNLYKRRRTERALATPRLSRTTNGMRGLDPTQAVDLSSIIIGCNPVVSHCRNLPSNVQVWDSVGRDASGVLRPGSATGVEGLSCSFEGCSRVLMTSWKQSICIALCTHGHRNTLELDPYMILLNAINAAPTDVIVKECSDCAAPTKSVRVFGRQMALIGHTENLALRIGPGVVLPLIHSVTIWDDAIWSPQTWQLIRRGRAPCASCLKVPVSQATATISATPRCKECGAADCTDTICQICKEQSMVTTQWTPLPPSTPYYGVGRVVYDAFANYF